MREARNSSVPSDQLVQEHLAGRGPCVTHLKGEADDVALCSLERPDSASFLDRTPSQGKVNGKKIS